MAEEGDIAAQLSAMREVQKNMAFQMVDMLAALSSLRGSILSAKYNHDDDFVQEIKRCTDVIDKLIERAGVILDGVSDGKTS